MMDDWRIALGVYFSSGLMLWLVGDIARTNRAIWREFREHRDRLTILETRCQRNHRLGK